MTSLALLLWITSLYSWGWTPVGSIFHVDTLLPDLFIWNPLQNSSDVNYTHALVKEEYQKYLEYYHKPLDRLNDSQRLQTFIINLKRIYNFNLDGKLTANVSKSESLGCNRTFQLALNEFADMFENEIVDIFHTNPSYLRPRQTATREGSSSLWDFSSSAVKAKDSGDDSSQAWNDLIHWLFPDSPDTPLAPEDPTHETGDGSVFNWASKDNPFSQPVTGEVHYQGSCGACWAFVAAASAEAAIKISLLQANQHRDNIKQQADFIPNLSAQELIDCDTQYNRGCSGGNPVYAFDYIALNGLSSWGSYPYEEKMRTCRYSSRQSRYYITKFRRIVAHNEVAIKEALKDGPVSVGVCGTDIPFLFYSSGIFDFPDCCDIQNHALLIVGFGHDPDLHLDYWIAQNSWGTQWGEAGFMRILRRDSSFSDGVCGLTLNPSQAMGGYYINRDGSVIVGSGSSTYFVPIYRFAHYLQSHWKMLAVVISLFLMFCSFLFLAYGLYLDRIVQCESERRASRRGYQRIADTEDSIDSVGRLSSSHPTVSSGDNYQIDIPSSAEIRPR